MDENLSLKSGTAFMDKCLETVLNEQRNAAHSAIDMDDWAKAQEILAIVKRNISLIEDLKVKFAEFKASAESAEETIASDSAAVSAEAAPSEVKPDETPAPEPEAGEELVKMLEELIVEFPFAMITCTESPEIGAKLTDNSEKSSSMKQPSQLSNGLYVDTAIPMDEARRFVDSLREYCRNHNS